MIDKSILKPAAAAIGVTASIAFYIAMGDLPQRDTGEIVFISAEEDTSQDAAGSLQAGEGDVSSLPGIDIQPETEAFSDAQQEVIDEIVRAAVRDELIRISEEGYLEAALEQAAELAAAEAEARKGMVNINTADTYELMTLSGIGESRAADIIAYREAAGGFSSIEDIMNVSGIGEATFAGFSDRIYV